MTMNPSPATGKRIIAFEVSKRELVVHRLPEDRQVTIPNTAAAIRRLLARWAPGKPPLIVCEATGGYERHVLAVSLERGLDVHRAHGSRVREFARYRGRRAKTDAIDARLLAEYGQQTTDLRLYTPPSPEEEALRALRKRRDEVEVMLRMERNRQEHAQAPRVKRSLARHVKMLTTELESLDEEIDALIAENERLRKRAALMQTVKGIGPKTAAACLAYCPELGGLTKAEAAAIAGLAPHAQDSGSQHGPRHIGGGRKILRKSLYMAAVVAIQYNATIARFAQSLKARGKPAKVVITAVMRKLIVILNAVLKTGEPCRMLQNT